MAKRQEVQEEIADYIQSQRQLLGALPAHSVPQYMKPRVWKVIRASASQQLCECTGGMFAVGQGIRTGCELPAGAEYFTTRELADVAYSAKLA